VFQKKIEEEKHALHLSGTALLVLKNLTVCYALFQYITLGLDASSQVKATSFVGPWVIVIIALPS